MKLGKNIRFFRETVKGLSQEEMAQRLNISPQAYGRLERDEVHIDTERFEAISRVLNVPADTIRAFEPQSLTNIFTANHHDHGTGPVYHQASQHNDTLVQHLMKENEAKTQLIVKLESTIEQKRATIATLQQEVQELKKKLGL